MLASRTLLARKVENYVLNQNPNVIAAEISKHVKIVSKSSPAYTFTC